MQRVRSINSAAVLFPLLFFFCAANTAHAVSIKRCILSLVDIVAGLQSPLHVKYSRFYSTGELADGRFSETSVEGGKSIWLKASDQSYDGELYYRVKQDSPAVIVIQQMKIEGKAPRPQVEDVLLKKMLERNPDIPTVRVNVRKPELYDEHYYGDDSQDAIAFSKTVDEAFKQKGFEAIASLPEYQVLSRQGFTIDLSQTGLQPREGWGGSQMGVFSLCFRRPTTP